MSEAVPGQHGPKGEANISQALEWLRDVAVLVPTKHLEYLDDTNLRDLGNSLEKLRSFAQRVSRLTREEYEQIMAVVNEILATEDAVLLDETKQSVGLRNKLGVYGITAARETAHGIISIPNVLDDIRNLESKVVS